MMHAEWRRWRYPYWDFDCWECLTKPCLDDTEYESEYDVD